MIPSNKRFMSPEKRLQLPLPPWPGLSTNASTAIADTLLRQAYSPLSQSTYCREYVFFPRGCACLSRYASARFRDEPP
jgi:hypothetical protein